MLTSSSFAAVQWPFLSKSTTVPTWECKISDPLGKSHSKCTWHASHLPSNSYFQFCITKLSISLFGILLALEVNTTQSIIFLTLLSIWKTSLHLQCYLLQALAIIEDTACACSSCRLHFCIASDNVEFFCYVLVINVIIASFLCVHNTICWHFESFISYLSSLTHTKVFSADQCIKSVIVRCYSIGLSFKPT